MHNMQKQNSNPAVHKSEIQANSRRESHASQLSSSNKPSSNALVMRCSALNCKQKEYIHRCFEMKKTLSEQANTRIRVKQDGADTLAYKVIKNIKKRWSLATLAQHLTIWVLGRKFFFNIQAVSFQVILYILYSLVCPKLILNRRSS